MSGMVKQKKYDIEDSNVALLGSEFDKKVRLASANTEDAWKGAGKACGMQIWRIEQFKVVAWPKSKYGKFHSGDSYICLNTYKDPENEHKLKYDIHFWLGATSTQDEYGTAAYKTVELDSFLGDEPVQHREVEGHESSMFCSYFSEKGGVQILDGGVDSGFNHVEPESYKPRLLHIKGRKNVRMVEVPLCASSLNEGDVFVLDNGLMIYQWQGKGASAREKMRAAQLCRALDDERKGIPEVQVIDQMGSQEETDQFWALLGGKGDIAADLGGDAEWEKKNDKNLFHLSDAGGKLEFKKIATGKDVTRDKLDTNDVFILDAGVEVYVWVGKGASDGERKNAMSTTQEYLKTNDRPSWLPVTRIVEGGENRFFDQLFHVKGGAIAAKFAGNAKSAPVAEKLTTGSGCYLTYTTASNGSLFLNWSHTAIDGALAYIAPGKSVPGFKFKNKGGREELTRGCDNTAKNLFEGWCNYMKLAKEYKSAITVLDKNVDVWVNDDANALFRADTGVAFELHQHNTPAVGICAKSKDLFTGTAKIGRDLFLNTAQQAGSALVLPKNK